MLRLICNILVLWQVIIIPVQSIGLRVNTNCGPIQGYKQKTVSSKRIYLSYIGIPFAKPPIGPLRYKVIYNKIYLIERLKKLFHLRRKSRLLCLNELCCFHSSIKKKVNLIKNFTFFYFK